jgi:hypothetical protein
VVTGAASGIGRATALRLARDGFSVAVVDRDKNAVESVADAIRADGPECHAFELDVTEAGAVQETFARLESQVGAPYALVNSAGILHLAPALELTAEDWRRVLDVNLTGAFLCAQAAARLMTRAGHGGRIVNVVSVHAQSPGVGLAHYDASKGGLWMLTRNLARELAPQQIAVNAVGPGLVLTNLGGGTDADYVAETERTIPFGRAAEPDEIAGPISFLCSDDASYITGAMLFVDGGMLLTAHT